MRLQNYGRDYWNVEYVVHTPQGPWYRFRQVNTQTAKKFMQKKGLPTW